MKKKKKKKNKYAHIYIAIIIIIYININYMYNNNNCGEGKCRALLARCAGCKDGPGYDFFRIGFHICVYYNVSYKCM